MSAVAKKRVYDEQLPFAVKQHVSIKEHHGVGNPKDAWNWKPSVPTHQLVFDDTKVSYITRRNTGGGMDHGEGH